MLDVAITITASGFKDRYDKGGEPYILHCLHVMRVVGQKTNKDHEMMSIAVMHDLVEDTPWTIGDLDDLGFSDRVLIGVDTMTHRKGEPYKDYIERVGNNEDTRLIKMVDLKHNSDITRMKGLRDKDFKRLEKYHHAYAYLKEL